MYCLDPLENFKANPEVYGSNVLKELMDVVFSMKPAVTMSM